MPRRKNQGQNVNNIGTDSTESMARNSDVKSKHETTLYELQSMFSGSVDAEVVQLVLSECNYNVNDAIEKLFVLSGTEQDQKEDKSSSVKITDHKMSSPLLLSSTGGTHDQPQLPRTLPSSTLPLSPVNHENTSTTILSSGLPDFPDSISQQYQALKSQAKVPTNFETFSHKEPSKHNTSAGPPLSQQVVPSSSEFSKTEAVKQQGLEHEPKGNIESFLKQMISHNAGPDEWEQVSHNNTEQQRLDWEPSKKKMFTGSVNSGTSVAHISTSNNKGQTPYKERTSNSNAKFTDSQNPMFSNSSQNIHESLPSHEANKPHFQQTNNNAQLLPNHGAFNSLSKDSVFRPPAVQRQFQPSVPPPQFGQAIQGSASQTRFGFNPAVQSPWQQVLQRPLPRGQIPHQYPQGTHPYQPPFFFGRAQPPAAVRPTGQTSAVRIPFFPTIHQKLLILIRGLPGSGKSTLAQKLKGAQGVVLSSDDYFYRNQRYKFDAMLLSEAHEWNQNRAKSALEKVVSPVIIDNTNTQAWEMKPYVSMALRHGYHIKFIEPDTTWRWNVRELARRNQHGVGIEAITRMKERFEQSVSVEKIMNCESKPDPNKNGNDSRKEETRKETAASNQNSSPRPQCSPHEKGSQDFGTRERQSYDGAISRKKSASNETNSSGGVKSDNNVKTKENKFLEESKTEADNVKKSDGGGKSEKTEEKIASEDDIGSSENSADDSNKDENQEISSPKPQRVPRVREKRSPSNQQRSEVDDNAKSDVGASGISADHCSKDESEASSSPKPQRVPRVREKRSPNNLQRSEAELTALVCEEGLSVKLQENLISRVNYDELELSSKTTPGSDSAEDTALCVEDLGLSKDASSSNSSLFSPPFFKRRNGGVIQEDIAAAELSKSSISSADTAALLGSPSELCSAQMLDASSVESDKLDRKMTDQHIFEEKMKELTEGASNKGQITGHLEPPDKTISLSLGRYIEHDVTEGGSVVLKQHEPTRNKSISTPPPLSTILASASRSKQKKRLSSNSDHKQLITSEGNSSLENNVNQLVGTSDRRLKLSGLHGAQVIRDGSTQENKHSVKDVSSDAQNLSDELQQATSGDSANDMPAGVEFLKTCFPDLDSDVVNALLTAKNGDVMEVVDELLANESDLPSFHAHDSEVIKQQSDASGLPTFPDSHILASQVPPSNSLTEKLKSPKPTDESHVTGESSTREHGEIPGGMTTRIDRANQPRALGLRHMARAQSPIHKTFQLTLEPAVALHLIEMFGPFAGVNFQEDISHEDLIIDVDNHLARQLHKKWEKSVQARKGISVAKKGSSPRASRQLTDSDSRTFSGDQTSSDKPRPPKLLPTGPQAGNLREIMDEQLALELSRKTNVADVNEQDIATKLKRQRLYEMFPGVDPVALEEVFQANRYELAPSVEAVKASCNLSGREMPSTVIASGFKNQEETIRKEPEEDWSWLYANDSSQSETTEGSFQRLEAPSYLDYRAEAFQHYKLRDECFKKAALAFSNKQGQLAQYYARQGHMHTQKIKEANARAAALILSQTNESTDENTIDLHGLHVTEAIEAVQNMISEKTGCKEIFVITGRGNNSRGGKARIKPAILEYLKKNNYRYTEPHPGLVKVFL